MSKIIHLEKNGHIKTMTEKSYNLLGGNTNGYILVIGSKIFNKQEKSKELTREQMVEALKSKGINVHHNLGDAKLKERYEIEIKTDQ